jgi:predicted HTH transcriptional regulator
MVAEMFDSPQQLLDRIRLGEDGALELKEVRFAGERVVAPSRDALADELAAFANSRRGGVCVLGVEDGTREIVGIPVERLDTVESLVREVCNDSIKPPLAPFIERLSLASTTGEMRAVLKIDVDRSLFVHQSPGGYFHRVGSSKREMPPDYLARLFQQRSQARLIRFDEQLVVKATLEDLVPELWERFRTARTRDSREDLLHKHGMAGMDDDGTWRPTVAGVLMATRDPRKWMPNAFIQAVAYRGTTPVPQGPRESYQLDAKDITGPLDEQVVEACRFVRRNMKVAATKEMGRRDVPQFDMTAVFEAVVNAVAHRDYSIHGSKIRLQMLADRLEVYSPGAISNTMTVESLAYRQAARNEALTSLLATCAVPVGLDWLETDRRTLMDKRGEGVRIILENSERLSGRRPEYRLIDDSELLLTIYAAEVVTETEPDDPGVTGGGT